MGRGSREPLLDLSMGVEYRDLCLRFIMFYCSHWFCSVDVSPRRYLVAAGRNHGLVRLTSVI